MATRPPLSERSVAEIRALAAEYRRMAETARTMASMDGLRKIADRLDAMADRREREERGEPWLAGMPPCAPYKTRARMAAENSNWRTTPASFH